MAVAVTVALAGDPTNWLSARDEYGNIGLRYPSDFEQSYQDREKVELDVSEDETLGAVLEGAINQWEIEAPGWGSVLQTVAFFDFYRPDQRLQLHSEIALLDSDGRVRWTTEWQAVTYRELLAAGEAGLLSGDARRPYLVLQPGIGNGILVDWQTLVIVWLAFWHILEKIDVALSVGEKSKGLLDRLRRRSRGAPDVVHGHLEEWSKRGARPDNVHELLGQRPWHPEDFAERFGCTTEEAEAFLMGAGFAKSASGLWRRGDDEEAKLLNGNLELAIHLGMVTKREAVEELFQQRVEEFVQTGQAPDVNWEDPALMELPQDERGFQEGDPRGLEDNG